MRIFPLFLSWLLITLTALPARSAGKDSTVYYELPDSVKAVQFYAGIRVEEIYTKKECFAGIKTDLVRLSMESDKDGREIVFEFPANARVVAKGLNTDDSEKGEIGWSYDWGTGETYRLLIAAATDSAANFSIYSGYAWLPREKKWKLIGSCRIDGQWAGIREPASFFSLGAKPAMKLSVEEPWCQRNNNTWKNMKGDSGSAPVIDLFPHIDSAAQRLVETKIIEEAIAHGKEDTKDRADGLYYRMIEEGAGRQVRPEDTVSVFYKLTLFSDGSFVDGTKERAVTFTLNKLIKGWQIGIPLCRVGGKIKLLVPSDLAYSIRTRSPRIPPNSILVFEIEVVDAR